ncbi:MAG: hypothetical protein FJZ07_01895 [Candidatus Nealsonbacteria bacterium]|nr:hypothetical protein [Candidatus Nealsonbacteria bacterium]
MAERRYYRKIYKRSKKKKAILRLLAFSVFCFLFAVFCLLGLFIYYAKDLPRPEKFSERSFIESTKIYDRSGEVLLYELYSEEKREIIPLSEVPEYLKEALISAEDANFYSHFGIDLGGIFRAVKINLKIGQPLYGGSTISQQLIRSTFLTTEKTIKRKVREIILTLELERRYSKEQILGWYLNQVPFGPNIYGVEAASKTFFNKSTKEISLSEAALLISLIKAPSYFYPYGEHREELLVRKDYVLDRMAKENYLTKEEAELAKKEELEFSEVRESIKAPHFVLHIQNELFRRYGRTSLEEIGFRVYTTLDWEMQKAAETAVSEGVKRNKGFNAHNASLVAIDPGNGEILAMVGSADWFGEPFPENCVSGKDCLFDPKVNIATYRIGRQPGSAFKPFVYALAFQNGYNDKYIVIDEETNFGRWGDRDYIPQNYDGKFRGPVTLRQALSQSLNIPSVKVLLYLAGLLESIEIAQKLGITTLTKPSSFYGPSIVLGGGEVRLLDMVSAYGVFATEGLRAPLVSILRIEDSQGNVIEENNRALRRVLEEEPVRLINSILSDNEARAPMFGQNSVMYFKDYNVAAKTGTTSDFRDGWIIGYTPSIVTGVWVGNNDNTAMRKEPGIVLAGPIWRSFMEKALPRLPKKDFNPVVSE